LTLCYPQVNLMLHPPRRGIIFQRHLYCTFMPDSKIAKKQYINRINYIRGHLKGVEKMINDDRYCIDVILQMGAVIKALKKITKLILENHLNTCMTRAIRGKSEKERKRKIKELLDIFENFEK